ncbi:hypothetical protein [Parachitinimonas caeni]|uniref:Piwi domain-containing protein n=1 Tax=Parachitinimonas caeni TaxID=3031301 RepID=A0ABT7DY98_9NEIS|nr:hypothetical protein [Parachitinimonas caeni]MDK2125047.1 hypothetical protein [Parachitinimonas caeni]
MSLRRDFKNLGDEGAALGALKAILDNFGEGYLASKDQKKPLSMLWSRTDRLATVELFIFGSCLQKVLASNREWAKKVIREIKKSDVKARGLCTEIIYIGYFGSEKWKIDPAVKNNPGYDFSLSGSEGKRQYISVKNIDISDAYKAFETRSRRLRSKWREKLRLTGLNFGLRVQAQMPLEQEHFDLIIAAFQKLEIQSLPIFEPVPGVMVAVHELQTNARISVGHVSDSVLIHCPSPATEMERYASKIRSAASNIYKHTSGDKNAIRVVFIRMHVNADSEVVKKQADLIVNEPDSKADCIIIYQPSYVRDASNNSLINHCLMLSANVMFAEKSHHFGVGKVVMPVGTISFEPAKVQMRNLQTGDTKLLASSDYIFQQADVFQASTGQGEYMDMGSPGPGFRLHTVFSDAGQSVLFSSKINAEKDDLLLI